MSLSNQPYRIAKTPFLIGDLLLLAMAGWIIWDVGGLPSGFQLGIVVGCLVVGMFFSTLPFLLDYRANLKRGEINEFQNLAEQLQALTQLEEHIRQATGQWQSIQDHCVSAVQDADKIAASMAQESTRFVEVMQSMDVSEKEHLRVEAEKLRRSERDWLQSAVRVLDHVFALHKAALQSGQPKLINQISNFQHAVVDVMRRMGLVPHEAELGAAYNTEQHQVMGEDHKQLSQPAVAETLAPGFTFQGRLVRPPLVKLLEHDDLPEEVRAAAAAKEPESAPTAPTAPTDQTDQTDGAEEPSAAPEKREPKADAEGDPDLFDQEPT
jgi:molecular chaperone GrpE (heat shock protein)